MVAGSSGGVRELLHAEIGLSFWGGVAPETSEVVDHTHPLFGLHLAGKILAIPNGRGSCTGSQVVLELLLNGQAPAAILLRERPDPILALGVFVAEEGFGKSFPIYYLGAADFDSLSNVGRPQNRSSSSSFVAPRAYAAVTNKGGVFAGASTEDVANECKGEAWDEEEEEEEEEGEEDAGGCHAGPSAKQRAAADKIIAAAGLQLTDEERAMLEDGRPNPRTAASKKALGGKEACESLRRAMRIVVRTAVAEGAEELLEISRAHIDAVTYIGPGGLAFAEQLAFGIGGKRGKKCGRGGNGGGGAAVAGVAVPTTLNAGGVDRRRWRGLGVDPSFGAAAEALGDAYVALGCDPESFTCAPYLLPSSKVPRFGEHVAWGESNAVVFSNSVLGARTQKVADCEYALSFCFVPLFHSASPLRVTDLLGRTERQFLLLLLLLFIFFIFVRSFVRSFIRSFFSLTLSLISLLILVSMP